VANGKGFAAEVPNRFERRGIGLANTQARLRELYESNQQLAFVKGDWLYARMPFK
jgi:signal transduction histidine kinase